MGIRDIHVARVSSTGQDEDNQIPDLVAWSEDRGHEVPFAPIKIHGKSAFHGDHWDELAEAVKLVAAGLVDNVVMWTVDRSSRQGPERTLKFRREVIDAGGELHFTEDEACSGNSEDAEDAISAAATEARNESKKRIRRIEKGYATAVNNGAAVRRPKYGWVLTGSKRRKTWEIDEDRHAVVLGIFERIAEGTPLRAVGDWAKTQDPSINWYLEQVRRMIGDPAYYTGVAETTISGQPYEFTVPALVPQELWDRANNMLSEPKRFVPQPKSRFTGILYCRCGFKLRRTGATRGMHYWKCEACKFRVRDDVASATAHAMLLLHNGELFDETLVLPVDTRDARRGALEREARGLSARYASDLDRMIARAAEIKAELAGIDAEAAPRGHVDRKPTGQTLGSLYRTLTDDAEANKALREHNVRITVLDRVGNVSASFGIDLGLPSYESTWRTYRLQDITLR